VYRATPPDRQIAGDCARNAVVERRGPAVELVELDAVRCDLNHELGLVDRGWDADRTDRN
jgi:hypothetical protein